MKKKSILASELVISPEILEQAKRSLKTDKLRPPQGCQVCGSEVAPNSTEGLCWVCRRLKISAWHEVDQQAPAQE